jgi:hypothetical protein
MGNVRTRITRKVGPVRTTTSWGGKRGVTTSTSFGLKGNMRTTYSTNQKTGRSRTTQSMKVGPNSWYVTSKTTGGFSRKRGRKAKGSLSDLFWTLVILGIIILVVL